MLGTMELLLIAFVVLILFGGSQLPKLARGLGTFLREFEKAREGKTMTKKKTTKTKKKTKK